MNMSLSITLPRTIVLGLAAVVSPAAGQRETMVPDKPVCPECSIVLDRIATVGNPTDPVALTGRSRVAVDSEGRFYVCSTFTPGVIALYDASGRFDRTFGRAGQGPGEFGSVITHLLVGPGDSLHVLEVNRHTVISPALGDVARVRLLPIPPEAFTFLSDGQAVARHPLPGPESSERLLHMLDLAQPAILQSFLEIPTSTEPSHWSDQIRVLGAGPDTTLWVANLNRYDVGQWTADGVLLQTVSRRPRWFEPWSADPGDVTVYGPTIYPRIRSIRPDSLGRLWVNIVVPDPAWHPPPRPQREQRVGEMDLSNVYDTIVEVIDVAAGRVVARTRFAESLSAFFGTQGWVFHRRTDPQGYHMIDVYRPQLVGS